MEAASEITTDQEDQTKDRESGGEKELTKGTGKASVFLHLSLKRVGVGWGGGVAGLREGRGKGGGGVKGVGTDFFGGRIFFDTTQDVPAEEVLCFDLN